jgi:hypothetical protein
MWTKFFDMSSGGSEKTDWTTIYIELPEDEATEYFENRFGTNPHNVTCSCCGSDFSVYEVDEEPTEGSGTLIIREADIKI